MHPLIIKAGPHDRRHTPVAVDLRADIAGASKGKLTCQDTNREVSCQVHEGQLHFVVNSLAANTEASFHFESDAGIASRSRGVRLRHRPEADSIEVTIGRRAFTTYHFSHEYARPFFYPLMGPHDIPITRHYPMIEGIKGETTDHVHHRSVWVAFGDVGGTDNWSELPGHAWQTHSQMTHLVNGPVLGQFQHTLEWQDHDRRKVLEETRTVRIHKTPDTARLMDLTVALRASDREVRIGDTKEGGICSVRVATAMDAEKGGRIENSAGGIGEEETWGKAAHWCDYSGRLDGWQVGIAVMDHPFNLRHPTTWHVRGYGLMSANPFGHSQYKSGLLSDGSYTIGAGESLTFRYRLLLHKGDARGGSVSARYQDYVHPPKVQWI